MARGRELVVTRRNEICRSSVPSDDDPMSASHLRLFLQKDHLGEERDDTESCEESLPSTKNGQLASGNYLLDGATQPRKKAEWPFICC